MTPGWFGAIAFNDKAAYCTVCVINLDLRFLMYLYKYTSNIK